MSEYAAEKDALVKRLEELDPSDDYHAGEVTPLNAHSYYAAIDRAVKIVRGDLSDWTDLGHNERAEGGAAAAGATLAAAKRVPNHQRPLSAPDISPLSARDKLDLELMARQGRTLGEKPWASPAIGPDA